MIQLPRVITSSSSIHQDREYMSSTDINSHSDLSNSSDSQFSSDSRSRFSGSSAS